MAHQNVQNPALPARVIPPAPLNTRCGADDWKLFKQMWQNYTIVAKLSTQTEEYQRALFLHTIGPEALTLYNGMCFPDPHTLNDAIAGFDAHFVGTTNETYERYFNNRNHSATESVEDYVAALRTLSKTCNFCDCMRDSLLRNRIVLGITDNATRKRLLQESALTSCIDLCRCVQAASSQLRSIGDDEATAQAVTSHSPGGKSEPKTHTKATRGRTPRRIAESNNHEKPLGQ